MDSSYLQGSRLPSPSRCHPGMCQAGALAQGWAGVFRRQRQPVTHGNTRGVSICHADQFRSRVFNSIHEISSDLCSSHLVLTAFHLPRHRVISPAAALTFACASSGSGSSWQAQPAMCYGSETPLWLQRWHRVPQLCVQRECRASRSVISGANKKGQYNK